MPKKIELKIPEPCHENWDKMTNVEKGRFCGSCQKEVVDFTRMSDSQLVAFFRKESTGSVCGRFMPDQLDRSMDIPKKRIPWVKYFFQFTLPLFLGSLKAGAQGKVVVNQTETRTTSTTSLTSPEREETVLMGFIGKVSPLRPNQLTGVVVNEDNQPIPYASIVVEGTTQGTMADSSGIFNLTPSISNKRTTLIVSCVGYESKKVVVSKKDKKDANSLRVQLKIATQGEVVVTGYEVMGKIAVTGAVMAVKKTCTIYDIKEPEQPTNTINMRVYPNPIPSGSAISIKCEKMEEDYYSFQVLTLTGQQVFEKQIWIDKEARVLNMPMPVVAAGIYFITVTGKESKKKYSEKIVIE